jgi:hypothetical protein
MGRQIGQLSKVVVASPLSQYREYEDVETITTEELDELTSEDEDPFQNAVDEVVMAEEDKQMPPTMKRHQTGGTGFRKFDQHSGKWV